MPDSDYDRVRLGIEAMTAYISGNALMTTYMRERRDSDGNLDQVADGATALCALLLNQMAHMTGKSEQEILQEIARGLNRTEQREQ
ncbi:hypothetical protein [Streptomyces cellulosae]|uniref:NTP pyrophosphohydrolase MazG putative catalytic core domain-containing protein n=1 Tax=Streptomyces cellulosae TaxID=1968 RepID=A0ABW7Y0R3_STRCE|nr:hypothetical protein [Streptomyces cellulosae]